MKDTGHKIRLSGNPLVDEERQKLVDSLEEWLRRDIAFVEDLMIIAARNVVLYAGDIKSKMDASLVSQVHDLFASDKILRGKRQISPSWYARMVYTLNPTGFDDSNCEAVRRNTVLFCNLYFPTRDDNQREFEKRNGIDLDPLYEWWWDRRDSVVRGESESII